MALQTTVVKPPSPEAVEPGDVTLWRLTVDQYHAMATAGILVDGDPVELLEGLLVAKAKRNTDPAAAFAVTPDLHSSELWRLSVEQYHAMAEAGILVDGDPVELLEGLLVARMTKYPAHRVTTHLVRLALEAIMPDGWFVDSQEPVTTADSEPEPDVSVLRGEVRDYTAHHPGPVDIALVIEVADSSLRQDRVLKKRIYARAGIAVYWIVNLVDRRIEVYTTPSGPGAAPDYVDRRDYGADEAVPVVVDGREVGRIAVSDVLPEA
jgi:Uma2 family endonuclease